jgi:prophage antirepressor-like protein
MEKIVVFNDKKIRRVFYDGKWYFAIIDIVSALTDSLNPKGYLKDMRRRDSFLSKGWVQIATLLPIETSGGKQTISCADTENIFRIIQSIPSKKAEPFKRWLAKVG